METGSEQESWVNNRPIHRMRVAGAIVFGLNCVGWIFADARWWSVHHLAFLSPEVSLLLLASGGLMLSRWGGKVIGVIESSLRRLVGFPAGIWMGVALILFVLLHVREPLWGDGQGLLDHLATIGSHDARTMPTGDMGIVSVTEPGETILHERAFRFIAQFHPPLTFQIAMDPDNYSGTDEQSWFFEAGRWVYIGLSSLAGSLLVFHAVRFAHKQLSEAERAVFLFTLFSGGGTVLFFGYVENYSWAALSVCLCMLFAIEESFAASPLPWKTMLAFGAAVAFHLMCLMFLPAVILLILLKQKPQKTWLVFAIRSGWLVPGFTTLCGLSYLAVYFGTELRYLIAPFAMAVSDRYSLLSQRHIADAFNLLILCSAVPLAALAAGKAESEKQKAERKEADLSASISGSMIARSVLQVAVVSGVSFVLFMDPDYGMPRDWDLFSVAFWPLLVFAAWELAHWNIARHRDIIATIMGVTLLTTAPFLLVNLNRGSEIARCETLLNLDPTRGAADGWAGVSACYRRMGNSKNAIRALYRCMELDCDPSYRLRMACELQRQGKLKDAECQYLAAAQARPEQYTKYLLLLMQGYARDGHPEKLLPLAQTMVQLQPQDSLFALLRGKLERATKK